MAKVKLMAFPQRRLGMLLLLLLVLCEEVQVAGQTTTTAISVSKFRTWIASTERKFRPDNASQAPLPVHAIPIPPPRLAKFSIAFDDAQRLVAFGGILHDPEDQNAPISVPSNELLLYDFSRNAWFNETPFSGDIKPDPRMHHAGWGIHGTVYIHAGVGGTHFSDLWRYRNRTWLQVALYTPMRSGHSADVLDSRSVIIFGGNDENDDASDQLFRLYINGSYYPITPRNAGPSARAFHGSTLMTTTRDGPTLFIFGGESGDEKMQDLWAYYVHRNEWEFLNAGFSGEQVAFDGTLIPSVSVPTVSGHSCASKFPSIICIGGSATDPIAVEYDIVLRRWIRMMFTNPSLLPPLVDHRVIAHSAPPINGFSELGLFVFGGLSDAPLQFLAPKTIFRTQFFTELCPIGFVNPDLDGKCIKCARGYAIDVLVNPYLCVKCLRGTYAVNGFCKRCPTGTYNPFNASSNASACISCPSGSFTVAEGSYSLSQCLFCPLGKYEVGGSCVVCPAGTFGAQSGQSKIDLACAPCNYGNWSVRGATSCTPCSPGFSSGPYIKRLTPYSITIRHMEEVPSGTSTPDVCSDQYSAPATSIATTVNVENWISIVVSVSDFGTDGIGTGTYDPLRLDWFAPNLALTAEFDNNSGIMYYECTSHDLPPSTCSSVEANETTPSLLRNGRQTKCSSAWAFVFRLRFNRTAQATTVTIRGPGLIPASITFKIESSQRGFLWDANPLIYVMEMAAQPLRIRSSDVNGEFDPTATQSFVLRVSCESGNPKFSVDGGAMKHSDTLTFVNGVVSPVLMFEATASGCRWNADTIDSPHPAFFVEDLDIMTIELRSPNVSNFGTIYTDVYVRNSSGEVALGDSVSQIELELTPGPYYENITLKGQFVRTVSMGHAEFSIEISSNYPNTANTGSFTVNYISGVSPLLASIQSEDFMITRANGTIIRLVQDVYPFPSTVAANRTFQMYLDIASDTGQVDTSRDVFVQLTLSGCPAVRIRTVNSSTSIVLLGQGRKVISVYISGPDSSGCRILASEYPHTGSYHGVWTPPFSILSPHHLANDYCTPPSCGSCPLIELGSTHTVVVSVLSSSGELVAHDVNTVVRMIIHGNASALQEVSGITEKRVTAGRATFTYLVMGSDAPVWLEFEGGTWSTQQVVNASYAASPTFKVLYYFTSQVRYFQKLSFINPVSTCPILAGALPVRIDFAPNYRVPTWIPNAQVFEIDIEALSIYNVRDGTYNSDFTVQIMKCYNGVLNGFSWEIMQQDGSAVAYTTGTAVTAGRFQGGAATLRLRPRYTTDATFDQGLRECVIIIRSGTLTALYVSGFQVRRLFVACQGCPPGSWSPGGNGLIASIPPHPGGCVGCMVGTFSVVSMATSENSCEVCPVPQGYYYTNNVIREGATSCAVTCIFGVTGASGGGPCTSVYQRASSASGLSYGWAGTVGRYCSLSRCYGPPLSCPAGQFRLVCSSLFSQSTCEDPANKDNCTWNATSGLCEGPPVDPCIDCPAGTVRILGWSETGLSACRVCDPGGWSSSEGLTTVDTSTVQTAQYRCGGEPTFNRQCSGVGTGQCWNGTYSDTYGATSNETCLPCPKGYYCHQETLYYYQGQPWCPPACSAAEENPRCTPTWDCLKCPLIAVSTRGTVTPIPCPEGTYNNQTGQWDVSHCFACPAGSYCPKGSIEPQLADIYNTQNDLNGEATPYAVSFGHSSDILLCGSIASSNSEGYVRDGHISQYKQKYRIFPDIIGAYTEQWNGDYAYDDTDRSSDSSSGSIHMNGDNGEVAWQKIVLDLEIPLEFVARVWIYNDLQYQSGTAFAGLDVTAWKTTSWSSDPTDKYVVSKSISTTATAGQWHLLELLVRPSWPIKWLTLNLSVSGWKSNTDALFDDAAVRPAPYRVCNCSTGFFYNTTEISSRKCQRCPPGFACTGGTIKRCVNSWSVSTMPACQMCRDGWLCDSDGRGRLIPCEPYTVKDNSTETCSPCPLGYACRDGVKRSCNGGFYGDGGVDCIVCFPGYYSPPGPPAIQCNRCPNGWMSNAGRTGCLKCPANHFSPDGLSCRQCAKGTFVAEIGSTGCRSCLSSYLGHANFTIPRNSVERAVPVIPSVCIEPYDFKVESVETLFGGSLGAATPSIVTPIVKYLPANVVGTHGIRASFTAGYQMATQTSEVYIAITNTAPVAQDDNIFVAHPSSSIVFNLTSVLFNDYDVNKDDIFIATAAFSWTNPYGATNLQISSTRTSMTVDLPAGFTGPLQFTYSIMDQFAASASQCIEPQCRLSNTAAVVVLAKTHEPIAVNDTFAMIYGQVDSFDVLANDIEPDGDEIRITAVTASLKGITPTVRYTCPQLPTCSSQPCSGLAGCTCATDAQRDKCYSNLGREQFIDYGATACGADEFSYTIESNDGTSIGWVTTETRNCYCEQHFPGIDVIFTLDGTTSSEDFGWQLSFVDSIQRRSAEGQTLYYSLFEVGAQVFHRNLSNSYLPTLDYSVAPLGSAYPYNLGAALGAVTATKTATGSPTRRTAVIIVSGSRSADITTPFFGPLASLGAVFVQFRVGFGPWSSTDLSGTYFDVPSFIELSGPQGENIVAAMDAICAL